MESVSAAQRRIVAQQAEKAYATAREAVSLVRSLMERVETLERELDDMRMRGRLEAKPDKDQAPSAGRVALKLGTTPQRDQKPRPVPPASVIGSMNPPSQASGAWAVTNTHGKERNTVGSASSGGKGSMQNFGGGLPKGVKTEC